MKPNWALNRAVYGPGVDLDEVLAGNVPPPAEFQPVYDLLNQVGGGGLFCTFAWDMPRM